MRSTKPKLIIVLGPTAAGKTELALELALRIGGEIVNADSQQVYRDMDIGTGKPSAAERQRVSHHVIDVVDPDQAFNAAMYRGLANDAIVRIHHLGKAAVVCGGTGLYIKALIHGLFTGPGPDQEIRRSLEHEIENKGLAALYERLVAVDPSVTTKIHPNDRQRIIRALEVYQKTGKPISRWQKEHDFQEEPYEFLKIGLARARAELYDQINRRSGRMIEDGLLEEVRGLVSRGFGLDLKPLRSVGYRQMGAVIRGELSLPEAIAEMKQQTRHLAKRQLTWFRGDEDIRWFHPENEKGEIFQVVDDFLR